MLRTATVVALLALHASHLSCADDRASRSAQVADLVRQRDTRALAALLEDDDVDLRCRAAAALAWTRAASLRPIHAALLARQECPWQTRAEAAWRLLEEGPGDHLDALLGALKDPDEEVRWNVARVLGHLREPRARAALEACAKDEDAFVAAWCVWAGCTSGCREPNMDLTDGNPRP